MREQETDVLVIGSGIAGLTFALKVADVARVTLVTKKRRADSNTNYAQGGIAAVMSPTDSVELHVQDTLRAGAGLCHERAVRELAREGPERVRELMEWGAKFTRSHGGLSLGREGGHSRRRIVHADDLTGREIERALLRAVADHPAIQTREDHLVLDLLTGTDRGRPVCGGAIVFDHGHDEIIAVRARRTLLASGGLGRVYRHTTNPDIATGDGVAMAYRAGAPVANLEFVQFHPTALYPAEGQAVLISEAVRGEGAVLTTLDGRPVMDAHPE
ncbi:MAG: FAD-dependent oxidoreductase, partial [Gemmatimonadetes bacterium]|nr:FAD-dependent oxidoreductase [Gemmatimonadota bacterium]NIQ57155.1 FAD-dependent oxidoreductase [Gemmatimonadota bacterium]NIU77330.1 FAD-dependent oxidoreductase [Gammaproteobacteria bacterium]NIX46588.1 FAD-dependent oxidoreductase [Gemmatimonadota bacterium]NIY10912.1 FAD-dependent oxidoreductase [Gemmatimonadota bacterium]